MRPWPAAPRRRSWLKTGPFAALAGSPAAPVRGSAACRSSRDDSSDGACLCSLYFSVPECWARVTPRLSAPLRLFARAGALEVQDRDPYQLRSPECPEAAWRGRTGAWRRRPRRFRQVAADDEVVMAGWRGRSPSTAGRGRGGGRGPGRSGRSMRLPGQLPPPGDDPQKASPYDQKGDITGGARRVAETVWKSPSLHVPFQTTIRIGKPRKIFQDLYSHATEPAVVCLLCQS